MGADCRGVRRITRIPALMRTTPSGADTGSRRSGPGSSNWSRPVEGPMQQRLKPGRSARDYGYRRHTGSERAADKP
jgi:hypothetical protein